LISKTFKVDEDSLRIICENIAGKGFNPCLAVVLQKWECVFIALDLLVSSILIKGF